VEQAGVIYKAGYWKDLYSQISDQLLAEKLFDSGVLFGVGTAVKLLQISMQNEIGLVSDGAFGPNTLAAVNSNGDLAQYRTVLINHVMGIINASPSQAEFVKGWLARIQS